MLADLVALTKPRITLMVVSTGVVGLVLAPGRLDAARELSWGLGLWLLVAGANALNMWLERDSDARMARTRNRPLPAGRLRPSTALAFGLGLCGIATALLGAINAATGALGLVALTAYVALYTPLKRRTRFALHVGALAGAMPPLMGWTAVTGTFGQEGAVLFGILFLWQLPHFQAIALFRAADYARAGLLVGVVAQPSRARRALAIETLLLVGASLLPALTRMAGVGYLVTAAALGAIFLLLAAAGLRPTAGRPWARNLFAYSMVYLTGLFLALVADRS